MAKIALVGKHGEGLYALVDDSDLERCLQYRWRCGMNGYVTMSSREALPLAHFILGVQPSTKCPVDHINRNKMDNRRENLRVCTPSENLRNRKQYGNSESGVRHVTREKRPGRNPGWIGRPTGHPEQKFSTIDEAARYVAALEGSGSDR